MTPPIRSQDGQSDYSNLIKRAEQTRQARLGLANTEREGKDPIHLVDLEPISDNEIDHFEATSLGSAQPLETEKQDLPNSNPGSEIHTQTEDRILPSSRKTFLLGLSSRKGLRFGILAGEILGTPRGFI